MDKNKKQIIITGVLIIVFIIVMSINIARVKKRIRQQNKSYQDAIALSQSQLIEPVAGFASSKFRERYSNASYTRDPFSAAGGGSGTVKDLVLEGIVWDEKNPYVIINGEVVKEGEKIFKYQVVRIEQKQVTLTDGIDEFILMLR